MEDPDASFVKRDDLVEVPAWDHSVSELGQLSSTNNTCEPWMPDGKRPSGQIFPLMQCIAVNCLRAARCEFERCAFDNDACGGHLLRRKANPLISTISPVGRLVPASETYPGRHKRIGTGLRHAGELLHPFDLELHKQKPFSCGRSCFARLKNADDDQYEQD